jgi:hypothetical protein
MCGSENGLFAFLFSSPDYSEKDKRFGASDKKASAFCAEPSGRPLAASVYLSSARDYFASATSIME